MRVPSACDWEGWGVVNGLMHWDGPDSYIIITLLFLVDLSNQKIQQLEWNTLLTWDRLCLCMAVWEISQAGPVREQINTGLWLWWNNMREAKVEDKDWQKGRKEEEGKWSA